MADGTRGVLLVYVIVRRGRLQPAVRRWWRGPAGHRFRISLTGPWRLLPLMVRHAWWAGRAKPEERP